MKTQRLRHSFFSEGTKGYKTAIEKRPFAVAYEAVCINIDGFQPLVHTVRNGLMLMFFLVIALTASAKHQHFGPSFGYHNHHYVYYPKQNFYYDPYIGTYVVYEEGVWIRQLEPPRLLTKININILPHVDVYVDSYYPQYYNHEHRHKYRLIYLVAPSTTFYVFRMPRRYDFTITPYTYYRPQRHIVFYNPNYYCHRDKYPRGPGNGHAYGHYKHRPYYAYNSPYHHDYKHPVPFKAKPHHNNNGGPAFGSLGKPQKAKPNGNHHPAPFGTKPHNKNAGQSKGNNPKPFGTIPQGKKMEPMNNGKQNSPAHPSNQKQGHGNGKAEKKNFSEPQHPEQNNGNWQKPGGNRERNTSIQNNNAPKHNREIPQKREVRPVNNPNTQRQERSIQYSQRSIPNENRSGGNPQQRESKG